MKEQVQKAIDLIRPGLQADGGDVELIDVSADGIVKVKLTGACQGCPMSQMTLKMGIEKIIAGVLIEKKWFADITDTESLNRQILVNEELHKAIMEYLSKLNTLNFSDPDLSKKIGELAKADSFLLVSVDAWNYAVEKDKKVAKVSMGMKLYEASTGKWMWKAGHHIAESYMLIKPDLSKVARDVARDMVKEMPH